MLELILSHLDDNPGDVTMLDINLAVTLYQAAYGHVHLDAINHLLGSHFQVSIFKSYSSS